MVWFNAEQPVQAKVYDRIKLGPGTAIIGPAIIEQLDATTLIFPGDTGVIDDAHNLLIRVKL
jgi:N-methylhydantoinase A/oxoprolinase/acetone carboxylase beta subunit